MATTEEDEELMFAVMEQSRELVSAGAMAVDLDLAFNMQMQEAMNASLAPHTSTLPILSDYQFEGAVADEYFSSLIAEDIARCEQEKTDRILAEAEMLRFKEEIGLVVHDMRFANELNLVPENQWQKSGDHIETPYRDGASSSQSISSSLNSFNLYTKGILSRGEEIRGDHKILGGIGIAVCDLRNNVVFRMAKPVVAVEMLRDVVELKALAEGLNIALQLGMGRVSLFTDDVQLHDYVEGKFKPIHASVASMLDQVVLLFRKFSHCSMTLLNPSPTNVNIAVKLAREAINSQIAREAENDKTGKSISVNCSICLEDTDNSQMHYIQGCLHSYCVSCMRQHVEAKLLNGILPKCPHDGCQSSLTSESCKQFLPSGVYNIFEQRVKEASIPVTERIYCPNPKCSELMSSLESGDIANVPIKCVNCHMVFCGRCKVPWHYNMSCDTYGMLYPNQNEGDAKLKSVAAENKWRQCAKCKNMVELSQGCFHIYCRCGHEFCYTCGAESKNKVRTCRCPLWDVRKLFG